MLVYPWIFEFSNQVNTLLASWVDRNIIHHIKSDNFKIISRDSVVTYFSLEKCWATVSLRLLILATFCQQSKWTTVLSHH